MLRAVRELDCSPEFRLSNFAQSSYTNGTLKMGGLNVLPPFTSGSNNDFLHQVLCGCASVRGADV